MQKPRSRDSTHTAVRALRRLYVASRVREILPYRAKTAGRRLWLVVARAVGYPISSPRVPRPPLPHNRKPMRLSHVLLACDLNPDYLDFWPLARQAWQEIVGIEPILVLLTNAADPPPALHGDPNVVTFRPVEAAHPLFQAQTIRLLYPALVDTTGAVLISDIDLIPLNPSYFHDPIAKLDDRFFVTYRDTRLHRREVNMMFNAAVPAVWGEIFDVQDVDDVRARLVEWGRRHEYGGARGEIGWYWDQKILYERLAAWPATHERLWMLDDDYCRYRRLDRGELVDERGLEPHRRRGIKAMRYSDYNCLIPYAANREVNDLVLELGLEAARRRRARRG